MQLVQIVEQRTRDSPGHPFRSRRPRISALALAEAARLKLRVAVDGGGCSGFQYRFDLVEAAEADDLVVERDGFRP